MAASRRNKPNLKGSSSTTTTSNVDYKTELDKAADIAAGRSTSNDGQNQHGVVSKLVEQVSHVLPESGRRVLGINENGEGEQEATKPADPSPVDIDAPPVEEFVRDAHRSQKLDTAAK